MNTALILGAAGQDGWYLRNSLLSRGLKVVATSRHLPLPVAPYKSKSAHGQETSLVLDIRDSAAIANILRRFKPRYIFNLAGASSVAASWKNPRASLETNFLGLKSLVREVERYVDESNLALRFYHQSSSEVFGGSSDSSQTEETPLNPISPYGEHKALAQEFLREFSRTASFSIITGITYNHESPIRPPSFVSRKISLAAALASYSGEVALSLGNTESHRDWGYAMEYMEAVAKLTVDSHSTGEFIISSGKSASVNEFLDIVFGFSQVPQWRHSIRIDSSLLRKKEPASLVGNPSKIRDAIGWTAAVELPELAGIMFEADRRLLGAVRVREARLGN